MFNTKKKKEKNCNKLLALFTTATAMLFGLVGVGVGLMKTQFKSALAVEYDDASYQITLSADELNNYHFENFNNTLIQYIEDNSLSVTNLLSGLYFEYNGNQFEFDDGDIDDGFISFYLQYNVDEEINFNFTNAYTFFYLVDSDFGSFTDSFIMEFDENNFANLYTLVKSSIELDIQANQPNPQQPMLDFVQILIGGIVSVATGVAEGVSTMAKALFLEVDSGGAIIGLSVFGGIIAIFAGLALAIAITSKVYTWITSLGN